MSVKKAFLSSLIIFTVVSGILYINSSTWYRLSLIKNCKKHGESTKAINLYNKILRKNRLKGFKNCAYYGIIYLDLGREYAEFKLRNLAIESYVRGVKLYPDSKLDGYYCRVDLEKDKLLAIASLESGNLVKAIKEFQRLRNYYPEFQEARKYLGMAATLNRQNMDLSQKYSYFTIGDTYIKYGLYEEARSFFTKRILDYGLDSLEVLSYLDRKYSSLHKIRNKIWGRDIYVTLEDFENNENRLKNWVNITEGSVKGHGITSQESYKGNYAELLDITYKKEEGFDFWVKPVLIRLDNASLSLGVRVFVKKSDPERGHIKLNIDYPREGWTGVWHYDINEKADKGWQEWRIDNLVSKAYKLGSDFNRKNFEEMKIDRIIFDTSAKSGRIFIDEIELFIIPN